MLCNRYIKYFKKYGVFNSLRKVIDIVLRMLGKLNFRWLKAIYYFKSPTLILGKHVKIHGIVNEVRLGVKNNIYDNCIFHFNSKSRFETGDHVLFSYHVLVSCELDIRIGNY